MQDKLLYEYAVVRLVPKVEREEFLNIGVVLYCAEKKFLDVLFCVDEERISLFTPKLDIDELKSYLEAFNEICKGAADGGPVAKLSIAERFRWLTATRSTIVQSSKVHPGFCIEPGDKLQQLYGQLVQLCD